MIEFNCNYIFLLQDLKDIIPKPDLRPLENHLTYLKRNISKALPVSRLCSKTDAIAYHRAATHLANFKVNKCYENVKELFDNRSSMKKVRCSTKF